MCACRCVGGGQSSHCTVQCHLGFSVTVLHGRDIPPHQVSMNNDSCFTAGGLQPRMAHFDWTLSCHFFCPDFFQRQTAMECFHGLWNRAVSCQPVDCGPPDQSHVYHAIFSCPRGTTYGKQCSFTCGSPAILQGKSELFPSVVRMWRELGRLSDSSQ